MATKPVSKKPAAKKAAPAKTVVKKVEAKKPEPKTAKGTDLKPELTPHGTVYKSTPQATPKQQENANKLDAQIAANVQRAKLLEPAPESAVKAPWEKELEKPAVPTPIAPTPKAERKPRQPRAEKPESTATSKDLLKAIRLEGFNAGAEKTMKLVTKLEGKITKLEAQLAKALVPKPAKPVVDKSAKKLEAAQRKLMVLETSCGALNTSNHSKAQMIKDLEKQLKAAQKPVKPAKQPKPINTEKLVKDAVKAYAATIKAALKGVL